MPLISAAYVKEKFPLWDKYFKDANDDPQDSILAAEIELAEAEFLSYLERDEDTISASETLHLFNIVKYRGFNRIHGDTPFEFKPQIVKDYENAIAQLKQLSGQVLITSNEKRFTGGNWFNDLDALE